MVATRARDDDVLDREARRAGWRVGAVATAIGLVAVLVWLVAFSSVLSARRVVVHGAHRLTTAQILAAGAVPHGRPLARLDSGAIADRVEALPDVASARVRFSYPSTVVITVTERVAVGYLASSGWAVLVDRTGTQFRTVEKAPAGLPRFDVPAGRQGAAPGRAVATVAGALTPVLRAQLGSIAAPDPADITLTLTDGRTVYWGSADRSADKASVLPALLTRPGRSFDVSDPDVVVAH